MGRLSRFISLVSLATSVVGWKGEIKKVNGATYQCKCYSDNSCFPSAADFNALNKTVGGALKLAIPPGAVCHNKFGNLSVSTYNAAACSNAQANWLNEQWL